MMMMINSGGGEDETTSFHTTEGKRNKKKIKSKCISNILSIMLQQTVEAKKQSLHQVLQPQPRPFQSSVVWQDGPSTLDTKSKAKNQYSLRTLHQNTEVLTPQHRPFQSGVGWLMDGPSTPDTKLKELENALKNDPLYLCPKEVPGLIVYSTRHTS